MFTSICVVLILPFMFVWVIIKAICNCVNDNTQSKQTHQSSTPSPYDVDEYYNYWGYIDKDKKY